MPYSAVGYSRQKFGLWWIKSQWRI